MKILKIAGIAVGVLALVIGGTVFSLNLKFNGMVTRQFDLEPASFPIPMPLNEAELTLLENEFDGSVDGVDLDSVALDWAIARGERYVATRAACSECHALDFGGQLVVDALPVVKMIAPNITTGEGGVVANFSDADWVRIIRHGINSRGTAGPMPSVDFTRLSDQEIADIVSYIRSVPPVDRTMDPTEVGPVGKILISLGKIPLSAYTIDHEMERRTYPPEEAATEEFGEHLTGICIGCHGPDLSGGAVPGGDPNWAPAANLTLHETGLANWTLEDFVTVMKTGRRPDSTNVLPPMASVIAYTARMNDVELEAIWRYLEAIEPREFGTR